MILNLHAANAEVERLTKENERLQLRVTELEGTRDGLRAGTRMILGALAKDVHAGLDRVEARMRATGISDDG